MKGPPFPFVAKVIAIICVTVLLFCRTGLFPHTVNDPIAVEVHPEELLSATDFHFVFGDGSGRRGYNVVKIQPDDTCQYTFLNQTAVSVEQKWRRAEFVLDRQTVDDLRRLLNDIGFFELKREYHADVRDGTQRFVKVEAMGKKKGVYCDNYFPSEIERIRRFVEERIFHVHRQQIGTAAIIYLEQEEMEPERVP